MDVLATFYASIHPPLVLVLCISGAIGHLIAIGVLTSMPNPTNVLLVSMSCSQLALCANFLYSTLFKYGSDQLCLSTLWTWGWTVSLLLSVNFSVIVEMCGVFHIVAISIIRYISLEKLVAARSSQSWFTYPRCWKTLLIIYALVIFACFPLFFQSEVKEAVEHDYCVDRFPELKGRINYRLSFVDSDVMRSLNFWLFGSICKIIPSLMLCVMSVLLVGSLKKVRGMSARFQSVERDRQHTRTTKIILAIMSVFICVEFPQGIMAVVQSLTVVPYQDFVGDVIEMITLFAACLIFALFCSMNSRLRSAFRDIASKFFVVRRLLQSCSHAKPPPDKRVFLEASSSVHETVSLADCKGQKTDL